jgi:hypothetical protein
MVKHKKVNDDNKKEWRKYVVVEHTSKMRE